MKKNIFFIGSIFLLFIACQGTIDFYIDNRTNNNLTVTYYLWNGNTIEYSLPALTKTITLELDEDGLYDFDRVVIFSNTVPIYDKDRDAYLLENTTNSYQASCVSFPKTIYTFTLN